MEDQELATYHFFLTKRDEVEILKHSSVLQVSSMDFSINIAAFQVEDMLDVLVVALFRVAHENQVHWCHALLHHSVDTIDSGIKA